MMQALILAFMGGLILNLMPCVFPILSMKALSLVKTAQGHRTEAALHGLSYTAGVVFSFLAIAATLFALRYAGESIGWGFQLQNPIVILLLGWLMFVIGLSLSGYFEFGAGLMGIGSRLSHGQGLAGAFATGLLAAIVATPCTAPFMGTALGFAMTQPPALSFSIFAMLGFGLAAPFLALLS